MISIALLLIFPILNSACPIVKNCLHSGFFNNKTCECECYSSYKGDLTVFFQSKRRVRIMFREALHYLVSKLP